MFARSILFGLAICCFLNPCPSKTFAQEKIPDTPAGQRLRQVIDFVNNGKDKEFATTGFQDQSKDRVAHRLKQTEKIREELGKFELRELENLSDYEVSAACKTSKGPQVVLSIHVSEDEPHLISRIELEAGGDLPGAADEPQQPFTKDECKEVVERLAEELNTKYVFPEVAAKMADSLQTSLKNNEYSDITDPDELASKLTKQLREICNDKHLRIRTRPAKQNRNRAVSRENSNHGFVKVEMLPGGVGYLKFNFFDGSRAAEKTAAAAMNFLANSKAIIFDLRENGGGSPDMIAYLSGYLFDKSVHLNSFYNRPSDTTTEKWSRDDVAGERLGEKIPVYVLTSKSTFSGAEEFSYNLKHLKRGTLVGETTGGGAHPVQPIRLGSRFVASMPFARAINPITKTNWEGTGVKPHVNVNAEHALEKALELAAESIELAANDSQSLADSLMEQVQHLMSTQEFVAAAKKLRQVVGDDPENGMAWFQLGYCLHVSGELEAAIKAHKRATKFEQVEILATYNLACAYALQEKTDQAIETLELALERGFADARQLQSDSDLDSIRDDDRFKSIAKKIGRSDP